MEPYGLGVILQCALHVSFGEVRKATVLKGKSIVGL
jgi:hypothetical protein